MTKPRRTEAQHLRRVRTLAERAARMEAMLTAARVERDDAIREAARDGVTRTRLAEAAMVARARLYQILDDRPRRSPGPGRRPGGPDGGVTVTSIRQRLSG